MEKKDIDILIVSSPQNIRYIAGEPVDYAMAYITKEGSTGVLCSILEKERASDVTWVDTVYSYNPYSKTDRDVIKARSIYQALPILMHKLTGEKAVIGIPFSEVTHKSYTVIRRKLRGYKIVNADDVITDSRIIKSKWEQDIMRKSIEITESGVSYAIELISEGITESELAVEAEYYMKKKGAEKIYEFLIVASGERSALPHGRATDKKIRKGEAITLDFVASYNGYYGDITRTVFLGTPDKELIKIYKIVLEALENAISTVKEGIPALEVDKVARKIINKYRYGKYFIHSTGHGIGLNVHEPPRLSKTDKTVLRAGMVLTVEPGIYIPNKGGVRIEEDILVTKSGCEVLSNSNRSLVFL
jgi:Xaa-Pro aminopeptidase